MLWLGRRRFTSLVIECSPDPTIIEVLRHLTQYAASWIYVSCAALVGACDLMMSLQSWSPDGLHSKLPVICSRVPSWSGFCVSNPSTHTWHLGSYHSDPLHAPIRKHIFPCLQVSVVPRHTTPSLGIPILSIPACWLLWSFATHILSETIPASSPLLIPISAWVMASPLFAHCTLYGVALYYRDQHPLTQTHFGLLEDRGCLLCLWYP